MAWKESIGSDKAPMELREYLLWLPSVQATTRLIGEKGRKRCLLTNGNGIPLSLIVDGANKHDPKLLASTLDAIVVNHPKPCTAKQHLCADAG